MWMSHMMGPGSALRFLMPEDDDGCVSCSCLARCVRGVAVRRPNMTNFDVEEVNSDASLNMDSIGNAGPRL